MGKINNVSVCPSVCLSSYEFILEAFLTNDTSKDGEFTLVGSSFSSIFWGSPPLPPILQLIGQSLPSLPLLKGFTHSLTTQDRMWAQRNGGRGMRERLASRSRSSIYRQTCYKIAEIAGRMILNLCLLTLRIAFFGGFYNMLLQRHSFTETCIHLGP